MKRRNSTADMDLIKKFLRENQKLGHAEAAMKLTESGFDMNRTMVCQFRKRYSIPYDKKSFIVSDFVMQKAKEGVFVSAEKLIELFGIDSKYAYRLSKITRIGVQEIASKSDQDDQRKLARQLSRIKSEIGLGEEWKTAGIVCGRAIFKCGSTTRVHACG